MSGQTGPRVVGWLDQSPALNHCVEYGGPYPSPTPENDSGRGLADHCMLYVANTGDGQPGLLMVSGQPAVVGGAIKLGPGFTGMQPNGVLFLVIQRCVPSPYPTYESFDGLGPGGEGYAAFLTGQIETFTVAPTPDPTELTPCFRIPGAAGFAVTLGDGINYGWGIVVGDATTPYQLGTTKLNDSLKHILTAEVTGNTNITLYTDGTSQILAPNDSIGAGGWGDDLTGFSTVQDFHGAGDADDRRDAAYLKAVIAYQGTMSLSEKQGIWNYLHNWWHTV